MRAQGKPQSLVQVRGDAVYFESPKPCSCCSIHFSMPGRRAHKNVHSVLAAREGHVHAKQSSAATNCNATRSLVTPAKPIMTRT